MVFGKSKDKSKKKQELPKLPKKEDTIIGENVVINGEIYGKVSVLISGKMKGKINISEQLIVKKTGFVEAEIEAQNLTVSGRVTGNSNVKDKTTLLSTANISGNITTPRFVVEDGAIFNGQCIMELSSKALFNKSTTITDNRTQNRK